MKNKIYYKNFLIKISIIVIVMITSLAVISVLEYKVYTKNFNNNIDAIVSKISEKYPEVSKEEIVEILNSNEEKDSNTLAKYGIDINNSSAVKENEKVKIKFIVLNLILVTAFASLMIFAFISYNKKQEKQIKEIIKLVENINRKNYSMKIDEISEDELSILKNEIYKTMIELKEAAENSLKDKKELKKSLEDISHQIKTPLTSIMIMLDNLIDDPNMDQETRQWFIRDIKRNVNNISFLVQVILKLSSFDTNTINFVRKEEKISDIINESTKKVSALSDLKQVKIEVNRIGVEPSAIVDIKWQIEAITNILKNCIEHSKNNSKIIVEYGENPAYSFIEIRDFGDGISEEDLPHIFERFYKGKNSKEDSFGIGLSLSKTIIEKDNGNISVNSSPEGSKFVVKYMKV